MQTLIENTPIIKAKEGKNEDEQIKSLGTVIVIAVILGLMMNWLGLYLRISMGFIGISMGSMAILLIARYVFSSRGIMTRQNLVVVSIVFGATAAVEAAMSILFLIWLTTNSSFYNIAFTPPAWLLPSSEVLASRQIFTSEWIIPLLTHYFLMTVPGGIGIVIGLMVKEKFIHNDEKYPFPGVIQRDTSIRVLTDEAATKGPIFWRMAKYAFLFSVITTFIPFLLILDFSNPSTGFIIGVILGPIGISLFAAGLLINKPNISIGAGVSSILGYSLLSIFLVGTVATDDPMEFFSTALSRVYMSPAIGMLLGGLILGPIFWALASALFGKLKKSSKVEEKSETSLEVGTEVSEDEIKTTEMDTGDEFDQENVPDNIAGSDLDSAKSPSFLSMILVHKKYLLVILGFYVTSILFLLQLNIYGDKSLWIIIGLMTWILLIGGFVNGYLTTVSSAQSGAVVVPPFIFDSGAIFVTGATGIVPFVATPLAESDGTTGIISSQKLANQNGISSKLAFRAYLIGYIAATLTTPLFSLLLWSALGIGTAQFPAPAFPVQGALVMAFATRNISNFLSIQMLLLFMGIGILIARYSGELALGLSIGLFFPPHLAIPLALGGLVRILWNKRSGSDTAKEKASTIAPAIAVGASFVIPILIVVSLIL